MVTSRDTESYIHVSCIQKRRAVIHTNLHTCIHTGTQGNLQTQLHTYGHIIINTYRDCIWTDRHTYRHTHIQSTYIHTNIHIGRHPNLKSGIHQKAYNHTWTLVNMHTQRHNTQTTNTHTTYIQKYIQ